MTVAAATRLSCPQGTFELERYPARRQEPLQAWNGADLLLLDAANASPPGGCLVVNDEHGALATALAPAQAWTDSALSKLAIESNCRRNQVTPPQISWSTAAPRQPVGDVFLRIPKSLGYLEYQLAVLARSMSVGDKLYCAAMDKHLSPQTAAIIERHFGEVERHRGQRKARMFSAVATGKALTDVAPNRAYQCDAAGGQLLAGANVFSGDNLDIGSRFLLEHLARLAPVERAADLACGNGVLGIVAMRQGVAEEMLFADESAMAVDAARGNCARLLPAAVAEFHHGDGLLGLEAKFDLVLCNPPFHLGHTVDDFAGRRLLQQAAASLTPAGSLLLVANRHLPYAAVLNRLFSKVDKFAQNRKFILWRAKRG